jgi:hypothetical protein
MLSYQMKDLFYQSHKMKVEPRGISHKLESYVVVHKYHIYLSDDLITHMNDDTTKYVYSWMLSC